MKEKKAKIAILLATYNGARYLREQLDSILAQEEQDWHLLISDDGSRDDTLKILEEYRARYPQRITLVAHERPTGSSMANFMLLTRQAGDYDYVMYCDQDDVWLPWKIGVTLQKMRETEDGRIGLPCLVHTDLKVAGEDLSVKNESFFYSSMLRADRDRLNYLLIQNIVTGCTMMINHALWELAVLPVTGGEMLMHDGWFALIAAAVGRIGFVDASTILYRQHSDNVVGAKNVRSFHYIAAAPGRLKQNSRSIRQSQSQAGALANTLGDRLSPEQTRMLTQYAGLRRYGKLKRLAVVFRYRIWLLGWHRKLAELVLI
ncbi:MAG: glycosyltransferase family 2 protein [Clostridia bacterium]|nr:glycosyltransferase family 2 protein [Clostridia bacterium]